MLSCVFVNPCGKEERFEATKQIRGLSESFTLGKAILLGVL